MYHIKRVKNRNYMITSLYAEKAFSFTVKLLAKLVIGRTHLNITQDLQIKLQINIVNGEKLKDFSPRFGIKQHAYSHCFYSS